MSGYVASARIVRSAPRLARGGSLDSLPAWEPTPTAPAGHVIETLSGEPLEAMETDESRLAAIRERWSQLTFYLFDKDSWRT